MKVEGSIPPRPNLEADTQAVSKRKRIKQAGETEDVTPSEEVLENQAVTVANLMANEIRLWKGKADTLLMDRTEYEEEDLKTTFKMLKMKKEEIKAKDNETSK